jgi:hypothetical protein
MNVGRRAGEGNATKGPEKGFLKCNDSGGRAFAEVKSNNAFATTRLTNYEIEYETSDEEFNREEESGRAVHVQSLHLSAGRLRLLELQLLSGWITKCPAGLRLRRAIFNL